LVNLHTTGDPIVPFSQASLYAAKVDRANQAARFTRIDVDRHGHCAFEAGELLNAFVALWDQVGTPAASIAGR